MRKRVEYQKYLRNTLDEPDYRDIFGLSDNIELEGEDDFVLQREFRIDFVFKKINALLPLLGIFSHFRIFNLFEFKSVNDPLDLIQLRKYIGELFWWLYFRAGDEIQESDVTLTLMTVRKPLNALRHLRQPEFGIGLIDEPPGHYRWSVMGCEVHLLVINELEVSPENYAWLSFAEGRKYEVYQEQLGAELVRDETAHIYLDILRELEREGKERMADEVIARIIGEMTPERAEKLLLNAPTEAVFRMLNQLSAEQLAQYPTEQLKPFLTRLPVEQWQRVFAEFSPEHLRRILGGVPTERLREVLRENGSNLQTN
jgi:hypothetical protein